jgi:hypothetical protein
MSEEQPKGDNEMEAKRTEDDFVHDIFEAAHGLFTAINRHMRLLADAAAKGKLTDRRSYNLSPDDYIDGTPTKDGIVMGKRLKRTRS